MNVRLIDYTKDEFLVAYVARLSHGKSPFEKDRYSDSQNRKTLQTLYSLKHLTPFEFLRVVFYVECPIYVARQLMRYRCASYVERSLRYCEPFEDVPTYRSAIAAGVKREDARALLPLSTQTAYCFAANMREMFHIFDERLSPHAQKETKDCVALMRDQLKEVYPTCLEIYEAGKSLTTNAPNETESPSESPYN